MQSVKSVTVLGVLGSVIFSWILVVCFGVLLLFYCCDHCCGPGILFVLLLLGYIVCIPYLSEMTSRKRSKNAAGSSSSQPAFDEDRLY